MTPEEKKIERDKLSKIWSAFSTTKTGKRKIEQRIKKIVEKKK